MRINTVTYFRNTLADLFNLQKRVVDINQAIASGREVYAPSDAPSESVTIMGSHRMVSQIFQYERNLESAQAWMEASESSIKSIKELLDRALVLAEQMSTGTYQPGQQAAAATEVENIIAQIITLANTKVGNSYIFGGTVVDRPPITSRVESHNPAVVTTPPPPGHGAALSTVSEGANLRLQLAGILAGAHFAVPTSDPPTAVTLGDNLYGAGWFNSWTRTRLGNSEQVETWQSNNLIPSADPRVSDRAGETLNWDMDPLDNTAGMQTYRTDATLNVSGAVDINIGADNYSATGAADLVRQINAAGNADYFAWLEGTQTVHLVSKGVAFSVVDNLGSGVSINQDTTADELAADLAAGLTAAGTIHFDGSGPFAPDANNDTVTLGNATWTWGEITAGVSPPPATAQDHADALAAWINSHSDTHQAVVVDSGADAVVQITARARGSAGNVALSSTYAATTASGATFGGMTGTGSWSKGSGTGDTPSGTLWGAGSSTLRLGTEIRLTVLDVQSSGVTVRARFYDDEGTLHEEDVTLPGAGEVNAVTIPNTGGVQLFRNEMDFVAGTVYTLEVGRYQGNEEGITTQFSVGNRMNYNWNARQILGGNSRINLLGQTAEPKANTGNGALSLSGIYNGITSRDFNFDVVDGGQVPGDEVTIRVSFIGRDGQSFEEEVTISGAGLENRVEIPNSDGVFLHLDNGAFSQGDSFFFRLEKSPLHILDTLEQWRHMLANGQDTEAQNASQGTLEVLRMALKMVLDNVSEAGTRQNRITVRNNVLEERDLFAKEQIDELQEVDLTEAMLNLRAQETAYNASLKIISTVSDLYLVNYI